MKNAYLWDVKHLIRRLTLPHSCPCLQREAVSLVAAAWGRFPAVLFGCFHHCGDPSLAQHVVYPKFAFNQERRQVLLVLLYILSVWQQTHTILPVYTHWLLYFTLVEIFVILQRAHDKTRQLVCWSCQELLKNGILGDWKMVPWFLLQNAVADIGMKASVLVWLCCWPCQSVHDSTISVYPRSDHPTSQSSNHLKLILWTWKWFHNSENSKGMRETHLRCQVIKSNYVRWSHLNMKVCKPLIISDRHGIFLTSLSHVLYFVPWRITPHIFSMRLILPQFSSLHPLFFLTYTSVTHL